MNVQQSPQDLFAEVPASNEMEPNILDDDVARYCAQV
jgi:hypothetical protein